MENDERAREVLTPHFPSNVVEDASDLAQELWDKVSKDTLDLEDFHEDDHTGYLLTNQKRFTEKEVAFLGCCQYLIRYSVFLKNRHFFY